MRTFVNNLENLTARRGLHCVWVPAQEGKSIPLVARWVETKGEVSSRQEHQAVCVEREEPEPEPEPWPCMRLLAA